MMVNIDGRMEQLLEMKGRASRAEGKEAERTEARDRREEIQHVIEERKDEPSKVIVANDATDPANVQIQTKPSK